MKPLSLNYSVLVRLLMVATLMLIVYYFAEKAGAINLAFNAESLKLAVEESGDKGIAIIIGLMAFAIVFNPVPSAPIALVAGAMYGHTWGTVYIMIGALIGALIAFYFSRFAGKGLVTHFLKDFKLPSWADSQLNLASVIFISRLIPFISFDLVSYAAGLTKIKPWLFFVATLFGLLPASFLLAHFGQEMNANSDTMIWALAIGGSIVLLPLIFKYWAKKNKASNG